MTQTLTELKGIVHTHSQGQDKCTEILGQRRANSGYPLCFPLKLLTHRELCQNESKKGLVV